MTIFDNLRKKRVIPDPGVEIPGLTINAREFVSAAFSPKNEKEHLITLSGEPDWQLILWNWDKFKVLAKIDINVTAPVPNPLTFQCSLQTIATELIAVVTGTGTYRYMKLAANFHSFEIKEQEIESNDLSDDYTCHAWTKDSMQLVVCTADGSILIMKHSGQLLTTLPDSPYGNRIDSITTFSRGFITAGQNGTIWAFDASASEIAPYKLQQEPISSEDRDRSLVEQFDLEHLDIVSLALNSTEDTLFYVDRSNQLLKYNIQLDGTDIDNTKSNGQNLKSPVRIRAQPIPHIRNYWHGFVSPKATSCHMF